MRYKNIPFSTPLLSFINISISLNLHVTFRVVPSYFMFLCAAASSASLTSLCLSVLHFLTALFAPA